MLIIAVVDSLAGNNRLSGSIPSEMEAMRNLSVLELSPQSQLSLQPTCD